jgi:hypothetical protein
MTDRNRNEEATARRDIAKKAVLDWMETEARALRIRYNDQAPGWAEYVAAEDALAALNAQEAEHHLK